MVTGLTVAGICAHQSWPYYVAVGATATHLLHQVTMIPFDFYKNLANTSKRSSASIDNELT